MTTENNKIIDDFVGSKGEWLSSKDSWGSEVWGEYKPNNYHSDWNLLMEVVEKIESLGFGVTIYKKGCQINDLLKTANGFNHSSKLEQTYNACLEFIKWYNSADKN